MCGRYFLEEDSVAFSELLDGLRKRGSQLKDFQTSEVFPGGNCLVLCREDERIVGSVLKWGIPKEAGKRSLIINARSEGLAYSHFFKKMKDNRCLVVASGYYEWDEHKQKYYFDNEGKLWYLQGIYDREQSCFVIVTQDSTRHPLIHPRQPIALEASEVSSYLC